MSKKKPRKLRSIARRAIRDLDRLGVLSPSAIFWIRSKKRAEAEAKARAENEKRT